MEESSSLKPHLPCLTGAPRTMFSGDRITCCERDPASEAERHLTPEGAGGGMSSDKLSGFWKRRERKGWDPGEWGQGALPFQVVRL